MVLNQGLGAKTGLVIAGGAVTVDHAGGDDERSVGWGLHDSYTAAVNAQSGSR